MKYTAFLITPAAMMAIIIASKEQVSIALVSIAILYFQKKYLSFPLIMASAFIRPVFLILIVVELFRKYNDKEKALSKLVGILCFCTIIVLIFTPLDLQDYSRNFGVTASTNRDYIQLFDSSPTFQKLKIIEVVFIGISLHDIFIFDSFVILFLWAYQVIIIIFLLYLILKFNPAIFLLVATLSLAYAYLAGDFLYGNLGSSIRYNTTFLMMLIFIVIIQKFKLYGQKP